MGNKTLLLGLCVFVFLGCAKPSNSEDISSIKSELHQFNAQAAASNLDHPWGMAFIDSDRVLVTQRPGSLLLLNLAEKTRQPVMDTMSVRASGQGGMLDVALDPNFAQNQRIYLSYVSQDGQGRLGTELTQAKLVLKPIPTLVDVKVLFAANPKTRGSRHFGGRIAVGEHLYLTLGDRGNRDSAQDLKDHSGSVIRLTLDGEPAGINGSAIFSFGHRNPQGVTWHPQTHQLWTHEHGPKGGDEINILEKGVNYGWPKVSLGAEYMTGTSIGKNALPGMRDPLYSWTPSIAPSGMSFYTGELFPKWRNSLFVGSLKFQKLVRLSVQDNTIIQSEDLLKQQFGRIRDVTQGPDGALYLLTDKANNGQLIRLSPINEIE